MTTPEILLKAKNHLISLQGHKFEVIDVAKPVSPDAALNLAKIISKLSPLVGNLIEFNTVEILNDIEDFYSLGTWIRQDPGFPDAIFKSEIKPTPGLEIKAWFPLATEITARFKDSQSHFILDNTQVALIAWLPESLIFGPPIIIGACIISGLSVAIARDRHYHNPPDYLVVEPNDTTTRTGNLQQSNTLGYKWQGTKAEFKQATELVTSWGDGFLTYSHEPAYQEKMRLLTSRFNYRLDTNFAKLDRIRHQGIEEFKTVILNKVYCGLPIRAWARIFASEDDAAIKHALKTYLAISDEDAKSIID